MFESDPAILELSPINSILRMLHEIEFTTEPNDIQVVRATPSGHCQPDAYDPAGHQSVHCRVPECEAGLESIPGFTGGHGCSMGNLVRRCRGVGASGRRGVEVDQLEGAGAVMDLKAPPRGAVRVRVAGRDRPVVPAARDDGGCGAHAVDAEAVCAWEVGVFTARTLSPPSEEEVDASCGPGAILRNAWAPSAPSRPPGSGRVRGHP